MWSFRNNNQTIRENTFCGHCRQCPSEPFLVRLLQFLENTFHREHILFFWSAPPAAPSSLLVRQASLKFLRMRSLKERVLLYIARASPRWPGSNFGDQTHTHTHTHTYTHRSSFYCSYRNKNYHIHTHIHTYNSYVEQM